MGECNRRAIVQPLAVARLSWVCRQFRLDCLRRVTHVPRGCGALPQVQYNARVPRILCFLLLTAACGGSPANAEPTSEAELFAKADLLDIVDVIPDAVLDIRYATPNNFVGEAVYPKARCLLQRGVANRLLRVAERVRDQGYRLLVWDCYRPFSVQQRFWELRPDERYVARPVVREGQIEEGSKHNRGAAVDLSLAEPDGTPLDMPTDFDDFSERAHRDSEAPTPKQRANAAILEDAMEAEGFEPLETEWWHYDGPGWEAYPYLNQAL